MNRKTIILIACGAVIVGSAAFFVMRQHASAPTVTPVTGTAVSIKNYQFEPIQLHIKKGETVTWTNNDAAPHIVAGDDAAAWAAGPMLKQGDVYMHTFDTAGTFAYHCNIHPGMRGSIVVTE